MTLRLVFLGTGSFALPTFTGLYETSHEVVGLVTQPDKSGRGHHRHVNPLKDLALQSGTDVFQPANANLEESLDRLREFQADLFVVAAYGQILSAELLGIPSLGAINLHASLLPKYRGAAPIQYAMMCGETETGITIFQIEPKLDAGPILGVAKTAISETETYGELQERLALLAVPLTKQVIADLESGSTSPVLQESRHVTKAPRLKKEDGFIDWSKSAWLVNCHIRAVQPWPKPSAILELAGSEIRMQVLETRRTPVPAQRPPGSLMIGDNKQLLVATADSMLEILRVQPEGKRSMSAIEFMNGRMINVETDRFRLPRGKNDSNR